MTWCATTWARWAAGHSAGRFKPGTEEERRADAARLFGPIKEHLERSPSKPVDVPGDRPVSAQLRSAERMEEIAAAARERAAKDRKATPSAAQMLAKMEEIAAAARERAARQRDAEAARHRDARPVAHWRASYCPSVGGPCLANGGEERPRCVLWAGDDRAGYCQQIAAMRREG